jgi:imidazolonepropionase-like amidohydrolase
VQGAPDRVRGEGPFPQLIVRGATLIDGTGAPPIGPVDVVVEGNRIVEVRRVGVPGIPVRDARRPLLAEGGHEIDAEGMFLLPGFIDVHAHVGFTLAGGESLPPGLDQGPPAEYVYKLWLAHGVTTIREPGSGNGLAWTLRERSRSAAGEIAAPRIEAYVRFEQGVEGTLTTPEAARSWVRSVAAQGADGLKLGTHPPDVMAATIEEASAQGLRTMAHLDPMNVARMNVVEAARLGLHSMEHWYGLPEALFEDRTVQDFPADYNYLDEQDRFAAAGRLWRQAAAPHSGRWNEVMDELLALDFTLDPTLSIYEASRDLMRARRAEWHDWYTLPVLWEWFKPNRNAHGSYWFSWSTDDEIEWRRNYRLWMEFVNEYKNRGGRVAVGSDAGFIYSLYGFAFIRELELLKEAGFLGLEVIRAATLDGAEVIGREHELGTVEVGKLADLVLVGENPLENLKVLYGTGAVALSPANEPIRIGGVRWVVKDGILFDAPQLLQDVAVMVREAKDRTGYEIVQPGWADPVPGR